MINILKAEFFKLKRSKAARICTVILLAYIIFEIFIMTLSFFVLKRLAGDDQTILGMSGFSASYALSYFANDFLIVSTLVTVIICGFYSGEYVHGLIRNSICVGVPRQKVFLAKFIMAMIVSAAYYCFTTIVHMTAFGIMGGWEPFGFGKFIGYWFLELLLFLSVGALVFMFSVLTRSTGATIGITFGIFFLFNILATLGSVTAFVNGIETDSSLLSVILREISMLFPAGQITIASGMNLTGWRLFEAVAVGAVTLAGTGAAGMAVFQKQDQK